MELLTFANSNFVILSLAVAGVMLVIRTIIDQFKTLENSHWYNEVILPLLPMLVGVLCSLSHPALGLVAGMFSSVMYRSIKAAVLRGLENETDSTK